MFCIFRVRDPCNENVNKAVRERVSSIHEYVAAAVAEGNAKFYLQVIGTKFS